VNAADKIASLQEIAERVRPERAKGRRVVLANGVFDLLHVGHVRYLEAAKDLADILIVAVNSDRSARISKGANRPLVPERERAELIGALGCVDHVLIFDEPDARSVIGALRPEIHAKGTDYTPLTVPERTEVESCGGRVEIVGDPKQHSSTELLERLAKPHRSSP
jgi:rfaE bifunctional protein nucleotidyltransferase chain/domain